MTIKLVQQASRLSSLNVKEISGAVLVQMLYQNLDIIDNIDFWSPILLILLP
jgi:hypothetical protein